MEPYTGLLDLLPATGVLFSPGRIDRQLVLEFFMVFARAEYALKRSPRFLEGDRWDRPKIKWDEYAKEAVPALLSSSDPDVRSAIRYLTETPPAREVVKNGTLTWEERKCEDASDPVFLIRSITTVRNNLFHGGKEQLAPLPERNRQLLLHCLTLLVHAVRHDRDVFDAFNEIGPEPIAA